MTIHIDDLNNMQLDVLREIGNIGAGNAATALAKMLNKKVNMDVPKVKILEFKYVNDILGGADQLVVGILLRVNGDLTGNIMFMLDINAAHALVDMLMGDFASNASESAEFSEIEISALKEIGNILASSYLTSMSALTNLKIMPSVPDIAIDMAGAILSVPAIEFGKIGDTVLYIETEFLEGNSRVVGDFFLVPDMESYEVLLRALGVIS
ncbi:MAG: chemotaxis protein CheC [Clostridiales bacterium]|jgi:chemotaxis protein CheC|nr:chemotaxis protein CheC [Eubacteriales bacterium]MDH7565024.1 chemotaxis protein CheC [Clostridiales bacterium]